ncbi:ferritin family protein [Aliterella atlantica]|uniref:Ferritin-like domain-containing protein n=1 Tax=Aliterella atlantica CENA595 TaxID=1618023 RepID=A0A0D8ZX01_9CYAN|nr:hypothetical protein [Aliterella atlantica]KJH72927.1 hypothetical protein UH38_05180 [Aliterella atlantica CENA595]
MLDTLQLHLSAPDLAGQNYQYPNYKQIQERIKFLVKHYLAKEELGDRLQDLPIQFDNPQPRPWQAIDWQSIQLKQIIGINPEVFLAIILGSIDTEAPIRGYTQTSRQYLNTLHPQLARFVGGIAEDGSLLEIGLWEKEERQHTPALIKIYTQLTGKKVAPNQRAVRQYQPSSNPYTDLYRHGLHRVATEYGATCLYLWLMAHTTGQLQAVLAELVKDEINHMTKFWGFGIWAFPENSLLQIGRTLLKQRPTYSKSRSSLLGTVQRMSEVLDWQNWSLTNKATFSFTCIYILNCLWGWSKSLTPEYLQALFGEPLTVTSYQLPNIAKPNR